PTPPPPQPTLSTYPTLFRSYQNPYHSKIQDRQLQQLIKTCNYWISQHNNKPSWDNRNYRNTACRAAREKEQSITNPKPKIPANVDRKSTRLNSSHVKNSYAV